MKRSLLISTLVVLIAAFGLQPAMAQQRNNEYNNAFGIGVGLADMQTGSETILGASFRTRIAGPKANQGGSSRSASSMRGYIEPEVQYVDASNHTLDKLNISNTAEDLLVGVNLLGVVPFGAVDAFFGGGVGVHFLDTKSDLSGLDESDEKAGFNFQAGIDVHVSQAMAVYVMGRFDLIEDTDDDQVTKIMAGLRFKF